MENNLDYYINGNRIEVVPIFDFVEEPQTDGALTIVQGGVMKFTGRYLVTKLGSTYKGDIKKHSQVTLPKVYSEEDDFKDGQSYVITEGVIERVYIKTSVSK